MSRPTPRKAVRAVAVTLSGLVCLLATAVASEAWFTWTSPCGLSGIVHDEALGWRLMPGRTSQVRFPWSSEPVALRFNRGGFRDRDHALQKPEGVERILVLGDSYTVGLETPRAQIFTTRLAELLEASDPDTAVEVLNAGVGAWATDQQYLFLRDEGLSYRPDFVLLVIAPNDVRETYGKRFFEVVDGRLAEAGAPEVPWHARAAWWLSNRSCAFQRLQRLVGSTHGASGTIFRHFPVTFPVGESRAGDLHLFLRDTPPEIEAALELFDALVVEMHELCRARGCRLLTAIVPTKMEFDGTLPADGYRPGKVADHVAVLARERGIPFLNLYEALARADRDPREMFIAEEYHFTAEGHAFVAEALGAFLARER